jgi:hypothetical protein
MRRGMRGDSKKTHLCEWIIGWCDLVQKCPRGLLRLQDEDLLLSLVLL